MSLRIEELYDEKVIAPSSYQRPIALLDLDDTLYHGLMMEKLMKKQIRSGLAASLAGLGITNAINNYQNGYKGITTNVIELNYHWAQACTGTRYIDLLNHARDFVDKSIQDFHPFTPLLFNLLNQKEYHIWLLTGEPEFVAQAVVEKFGGTGFAGTLWQTEEGIITGKIKNPLTGPQKGICAGLLFDAPIRYRYKKAGSIAMVDSLNDTGLVDTVPFSVVCGQPSKEFNDYLERCGKTFVIVSPWHTKQIIRFVDRLTKQTI